MKTMIRALAALWLLALAPGLFAGSINLVSDNPYLIINVNGGADCNVQVIDNSTNQVVVEAIVYVGGSGSIWSNPLGLDINYSSSGTIEVFDLPAGDYRIQTTLPYGWIWNFYNTFSVGWGMIVDYDNYYTVEVQTEINNTGGAFY